MVSLYIDIFVLGSYQLSVVSHGTIRFAYDCFWVVVLPVGMTMASSGAEGRPNDTRKVLVLHGSRQTGQLLLGRMDKLRKKLETCLGIQLVAPDATWSHKLYP